MTQRGLPDLSRCARLVIKDFVCGKLLFCECPPGAVQSEFHTFPEQSNKPRTDPKHLDASKQYKVDYLIDFVIICTDTLVF